MMNTECANCGWMGPLTDLKDHPLRPMPCDFGFCPECTFECDGEIFDDEEMQQRLKEYE